MTTVSLYEFCDEHDLNITSFFKTLISISKVDFYDDSILGELDVEECILEEALKVSQSIPEPFFCDYLEDGHRTRLMIQPQRVWFGTLPGTQEQHWLLTALNIQTDEEIILRLSNINA